MSRRRLLAVLLAAAVWSGPACRAAIAGEACLDDAALAAALPGKSKDYVSVVPGGGAGSLAQTKDQLLLYDGCRLRALPRPPQEESALYAWVFSPTDIWLRTSPPKGGKGFRVVRFDGRGWTELAVPGGGEGPRALWAFGPRDVWIGGGSREQLALYHWDGRRLSALGEALPPKTPGPAVTIGGPGPNDLWVAVESGSFLFHSDGKTWRRVDTDFDVSAAAFWSGRGGTTWAIVSSSGFSLHRWDGARWRLAAHFAYPLAAIAGFGDQPWVVGAGRILVPDRDWEWQPAVTFGGDSITHLYQLDRERRPDPLATRIPMPSVQIGEPRVVSERRAFALATWNGIVVALRWDGRVWTAIGKLPAETVTAILTTASGDVFATTAATWTNGARPLGRVLQRRGSAWPAIGEAPAPLLELAEGEATGGAAGDVWAIGDAGVALRCSHGACARVPTGATETLVGVWRAGAGRLRVGGSGGSVLEWDGRAWTPIAPPRGWSLAAMAGVGSDTVWGLGTEPLRLSVVGSVAAWNTPGDFESVTYRRQFFPSSMAVLAPDDVWISGAVMEERSSRADVLHWDGKQWGAFPRSLYGVTSRVVQTGGRLWLAGAQGRLWRRAGAGWEVLDSGTTDAIRVLAAAGDDVWIATADDAVPRLVHPQVSKGRGK